MKKPDTPCAGCGKLLYTSPSSLPAGQRTCHDCRRTQPKPAKGTCATCSGPLYGQAKIYCSWQCSNGRAGTRAGSRTAKPCEICGQQFKAKGSGSTPGYVQRTCSRACGVELRRRIYGWVGNKPPRPPVPPPSRDCRDCGAELGTARQRLCSNCAAERRRAHAPGYSTCPCGVTIQPQRNRCDTCLADSRKRQRQSARRARRARKRNARREPYTLAEIAARDRYRCGFCRKRVAMTKAVPHPSAPTIDHIIPLAVGGDDTRANVQLAHFLCNSLAGATGTKQAALFG